MENYSQSNSGRILLRAWDLDTGPRNFSHVSPTHSLRGRSGTPRTAPVHPDRRNPQHKKVRYLRYLIPALWVVSTLTVALIIQVCCK